MAGNANSGRKIGFRHNETTRNKIRAGVIITRLQAEFDGNTASKKAPLTELQVKIGFGLLRKILPDLQSVEHTGDEDNPLHHVIERRIVDPKG